MLRAGPSRLSRPSDSTQDCGCHHDGRARRGRALAAESESLSVTRRGIAVALDLDVEMTSGRVFQLETAMDELEDRCVSHWALRSAAIPSPTARDLTRPANRG